MSTDISAMPDLGALRAALGETFHIQTPSGGVPCSLRAVREAPAVDALHECYAAEFALPPGVRGTQGTYSLSGPVGQRWDLFMTALAPDAEGSQCLEAVIHRRRLAEQP